MLAVVTGGGRGMGRELVCALAAEGCSVAACDLNESALRETIGRAQEDAPGHVRLTVHTCDVSDRSSVARFREDVLASHGTNRVNLLFNNAGIAGAGSFVNDDVDKWERTFRVCWDGVYNCTREFLPALIASDEAHIVNTSSANGFWAMHGPGVPATAYSAAKFAVKGFSEGLIEDLRVNAPHVSVSVVMPGNVRTQIGANSAQILGMRDASAELRGLQLTMQQAGLPVARASEEQLHQLLAAVVVLQDDPGVSTTAGQAASIILDGVRRKKWRILVGADVERLDIAVRANPEGAYEPGGVSLPPDWFWPIVGLLGLSPLQADLSATYGFAFDGHALAVRINEGTAALAGEHDAPSVVVKVAPNTLMSLVTGELELGQADALVEFEGDRSQFEKLLQSLKR